MTAPDPMPQIDSLLERVRAGSECAPWVVEELLRLRRAIAEATFFDTRAVPPEHPLAARLALSPQPEAVVDVEEEETYRLGYRDGYEEAVQDIDVLTGGDGEYRYCTDHDPDRHTPDSAAMKARIEQRFDDLRAHAETIERVERVILRDAARYRWLRDQTTDDNLCIVGKSTVFPRFVNYSKAIDEYIDAAIAQRGGVR